MEMQMCSRCRKRMAVVYITKYENGETERINTDESWKCTQGEIRRTDIYMGEYVDHRLSLGNFSAPDYDDLIFFFHFVTPISKREPFPLLVTSSNAIPRSFAINSAT